MKEIYKQLELVNNLNEAVKTLLDQLFEKLRVAYLHGVYFIDLNIDYGEKEALDANANLIAEIKRLNSQHESLRHDLREEQTKLGSMCHEKFIELANAVSEGDKSIVAYLTGEYNLAVSLGGVIPFLAELSKIV